MSLSQYQALDETTQVSSATLSLGHSKNWKNHCFLYHVKLRSDPKPAVFVQSTRQYLASDVGNSASGIPGVIIATTDF